MEGDNALTITTCEMHTGGEPVRIVESGYPILEGETILEKRKYAQSHLDHYRKLLINEPRGHDGMYGVILTEPIYKDAHLAALFIHNDGYSTMCGHAVIALGRYAVDKGYVVPTSPETEVVLEVPCGQVRAFVEYNDKKSSRVRFHSVPAFVYQLGMNVKTSKYGNISVDIAYGGAFYAILKASQIGLCLETTSTQGFVNAGHEITEAVKSQVTLYHPESQDLSFLYGAIFTDDNDAAVKQPTKNICIFADKEVDRSPTGSGVTARIALQYKKGYIGLNEQRIFTSITDASFTGKAIKNTKCGNYDAIIVEVAGMAHYMGNHTFVLESSDPLPEGFRIS